MSRQQRMEVATDFIGSGYVVRTVLRLTTISPSSWYYRPVEQLAKRGARKSTYTITTDGKFIPNQQVVSEIKQLLSHEFVDYGYLKVTHWLRQEKHYVINPKKVYRLMREAGLLFKSTPIKKSKRRWVGQLVPETKQPFDYLEFDIKYCWVAGQQKNVMVLSVIDVNTRWVLGHFATWRIKEHHLRKLFDQLFAKYPLPHHFYVRNDNGSQFIASQVQRYFEQKNVTQEFCKPATPEQNAHIESYHSIMEAVICQRFEFATLTNFVNTLNRFVKFYNFKRIHSGVGYTSPFRFLLKKGIDMGSYDLDDALDCSYLKSIVKSNYGK